MENEEDWKRYAGENGEKEERRGEERERDREGIRERKRERNNEEVNRTLARMGGEARMKWIEEKWRERECQRRNVR